MLGMSRQNTYLFEVTVNLPVAVRRGDEGHREVADTRAVFGLDDQGQVRLDHLEIEARSGEDITALVLRNYPLAIATGIARRALYDSPEEQQADEPFAQPGLPLDDEWPELTRPDGTDAWYQQFGRLFLLASAWSPAPAKRIAEQWGYPVSAVHRWTKEARRRGFLPPDARSRSNR